MSRPFSLSLIGLFFRPLMAYFLRVIKMFVLYNPNPAQNIVGDCVVRAISRLLDIDWQNAYVGVIAQGYKMYDMPSSNSVWGAFLKDNGYKRHTLPDTCPDCYTVAEFCQDYPSGRYLLATGSHVVTVVDGDYYDTWDSGNETPIYYWTKEG